MLRRRKTCHWGSRAERSAEIVGGERRVTVERPTKARTVSEAETQTNVLKSS